MDKKLYRKILAMAPLFRALSPDELSQIVGISKVLRVRSGVTVVEEGDVASAMYVLVEGTAEVNKDLPGGDTTRLALLKAPTVFGEMALIDRHPRSATVATTSDAVLFQIDLESFNELRSAYQPAAFKVLRAVAPLMCERLRGINEKVGEFFKNPEQDLSSIEKQFLGSASTDGTSRPGNGGGA